MGDDLILLPLWYRHFKDPKYKLWITWNIESNISYYHITSGSNRIQKVVIRTYVDCTIRSHHRRGPYSVSGLKAPFQWSLSQTNKLAKIRTDSSQLYYQWKKSHTNNSHSSPRRLCHQVQRCLMIVQDHRSGSASSNILVRNTRNTIPYNPE